MISIILPTYNRAAFLTRAIESVLLQTFKNWELLIVDDGSEDHTKEVIGSFRDSRIKYFFKENSGAAHSRNVGVDRAEGEYIIFLDSDDEAQPDWLKHFYDKIISTNAPVISCGYETYDHYGNVLEVIMPRNLGPMFNNVTTNFLSGTFMVKKSYFLLSKGYDAKLTSGQHTEFLLRLLKIFVADQVKIVNIEKSLMKIHVHNEPRIRHDDNALYLGSVRMFKKYENLFQNNENEYYNYLSVAGVAAIRTKRFKEGKKFFLKAYELKPLKVQSLIRLIISNIPLFREKFWAKNISFQKAENK